MLSYRCPLCTHLLQAQELRAGKKSVCEACHATHIVPLDRAAWLSEAGEPLFPVGDSSAVTPSPAFSRPQELISASADKHSDESTDPSAGLPRGQPGPRLPTRADFQEPEPVPRFPARRPQLPPPQPSPVAEPVVAVVRAPAEGAEAAVAVTIDEPVHVQTQAEIAAALTEVLARRMRPPRNPRRDLRPSTAGWLILTGAAIAFTLVTLFTRANYAKTVLAFGVLQAFAGYAWIVFMTYMRRPQRGFACAVPPLTIYYLSQSKYAQYRPLRFVATGVALAAVAVALPRVAPVVRGWVGRGAPPPAEPPANPAQMSNLERLNFYKQHREYDRLIGLMLDLAKTDSLKSADARDGQALAAELKDLCGHPDTSVKTAAMTAYARWGGIDAREVCLTALRSSSQEERLTALQLLPQWKGADESAVAVAKAVASMITGRPGSVTSTQAEQALVEIGGTAAEQAALGLLLRSEDQQVRLVTLTVLEKVGGEKAVVELQAFAQKQVDPIIKQKALDTIEAIQLRERNDKARGKGQGARGE